MSSSNMQATKSRREVMNASFGIRLFSICLALLIFSSLQVRAQRSAAVKSKPPDTSTSVSPEQQDAIDLLRTLAQNLKTESDKLSAAKLQARIANELWLYDESFARDTFRWAFEAATQPIPEGLPETKQSAYIVKQAQTLNDVLTKFGLHDGPRAQAWLKSFESERLIKNPSAKTNTTHFELLMQVALQSAATNTDQAFKLGVLALSGNVVPTGFPQLLFAVSNQDPKLSNELLRTAIATLRRQGYVHDPSLIAMSNYLFSPNGELRSALNLVEAELLANYFVDAAWRQPGGEGTPLSPSSASLYSLLETRATPVVTRYTPNRLPELHGQMSRMASGLTAEQAQRTNLLRTTQQQQDTVSGRNDYSLDEQIARAEKEKDLQVRDALYNSIAHTLMRQDTEKALAVTGKIDDKDLRMTTEDDVNLVKIQQCFHSKSYDEARQTSEKLNNSVFRAKVLVQLAAKILSDSKDGSRAGELLAEATRAALKSDDSADKVLALLHTVAQYARFDTIQAFDSLNTAIATLNRMKTEKEPVRSVLVKPALLRIKSYTVLNGTEMTTTNDATLESIDFNEVRLLVIQDYMQSRLAANKIEQPLQRASYLTAVATTALKAQSRSPLATSKN
jgi:urease gamma subunit